MGHSESDEIMRGESIKPVRIATGSSVPKLMVYEFRQDDPKKCTSARLRKFRLVQGLASMGRIRSSAVVLNPTSSKTLSREDRESIQSDGLVALECSWNLSEGVFDRNIPGNNRRLPILLAENPTNYGIAVGLSTAEALAAALILTGSREQAGVILSLFESGATVLTLIHDPLENYEVADSYLLSHLTEETCV